MRSRFYKDSTTITFPCEFLNGTIRAYFVRIGNKELFLSRKYTKKLENSVNIPLWLAKKAELMK